MASAEVDGIIRWTINTGTPFKVTDINTPGVHVAGSYHYRAGTGDIGLAVDLAYTRPTLDSPQLLAIFAAFGPIETRLAELIYSGAPYNIKNGQRVPPYATTAHHNHVHVAVELGTILAKEITIVPDDPALPNLYAPLLGFYPIFDSTGHCTGYYMVSTKGEVHAYGPGTEYYGRSEVVDQP